ncbi:MAG: hypothetical protein WA002_06630, partial [Candidatus Acidiferrales bacterium]
DNSCVGGVFFARLARHAYRSGPRAAGLIFYTRIWPLQRDLNPDHRLEDAPFAGMNPKQGPEVRFVKMLCRLNTELS